MGTFSSSPDSDLQGWMHSIFLGLMSPVPVRRISTLEVDNPNHFWIYLWDQHDLHEAAADKHVVLGG